MEIDYYYIPKSKTTKVIEPFKQLHILPTSWNSSRHPYYWHLYKVNFLNKEICRFDHKDDGFQR